MDHAKRSGFTLIELLVFSAISSLTLVAFITILIVILRIQVRQQAVAEVNQQSQFLIQTIQGYVQRASIIDIAGGDNSTSTYLKLRTPSSTNSYVEIYRNAADGDVRVCLGDLQYCGAGTQTSLISNKVTVNNLTFTFRTNSSTRESVGVSFTMSYNTANPKQAFSQFLQTSATRMNSALFDSDVLPQTGGYDLGTLTPLPQQTWSDINRVFFMPLVQESTSTQPYLMAGINVIPSVRSVSTTPIISLQIGGGDVYIDNSDSASDGIIMEAPGGVCWKWYPSTTGAVIATTTGVTCL